jgi:hypothetical protein
MVCSSWFISFPFLVGRKLQCPTQQKAGVTTPTCTTTTITLEPCALNVLKFPFFAKITERKDREWKQAQKQGDFLDNSSTQKTKGGPKLGFVT